MGTGIPFRPAMFTALLYDPYHGVPDHCVVVGVALEELLCHYAALILVTLHLHHCVVVVGIKLFADRLDGLLSDRKFKELAAGVM